MMFGWQEGHLASNLRGVLLKQVKEEVQRENQLTENHVERRPSNGSSKSLSLARCFSTASK